MLAIGSECPRSPRCSLTRLSVRLCSRLYPPTRCYRWRFSFVASNWLSSHSSRRRRPFHSSSLSSTLSSLLLSAFDFLSSLSPFKSLRASLETLGCALLSGSLALAVSSQEDIIHPTSTLLLALEGLCIGLSHGLGPPSIRSYDTARFLPPRLTKTLYKRSKPPTHKNTVVLWAFDSSLPPPTIRSQFLAPHLPKPSTKGQNYKRTKTRLSSMIRFGLSGRLFLRLRVPDSSRTLLGLFLDSSWTLLLTKTLYKRSKLPMHKNTAVIYDTSRASGSSLSLLTIQLWSPLGLSPLRKSSTKGQTH